MITHSAIRKDGIIYIGKRHDNVIAMGGLKKLFPWGYFKGCEQGFLTQDGRFLNRKEAGIYVLEIKQPLLGRHPFEGNGRDLTSESLWAGRFQ